MKTLNEILQEVVTVDQVLCTYEVHELPQAARARVWDNRARFEGCLSADELIILDEWSAGSRASDAKAAFRGGGEYVYYVFPDGSLYFRSRPSGESEVWSDAGAFATERVLRGWEGPLDKMDDGLLRYLGGRLEEIAEERGTR